MLAAAQEQRSRLGRDGTALDQAGFDQPDAPSAALNIDDDLDRFEHGGADQVDG
jgi:hypothetical protein